MSQGTVLIMASLDRSLVTFRGRLIGAMRAAGWAVTAAAPAEDSSVPAALDKLGASYRSLALARAGLNPVRDVGSFVSCVSTVRAVRPDVVLAYTLKPVVFGCLAARFCGVPRIYALITGLGTAFFSRGFKGRVLSRVAAAFYRAALPRCTKVFVQNAEIARFLTERRIVDAERIVVVRGSGVDLGHFAPQPVPAGAPTFLFLGRFLKDKGIFELVAAAGALRRRHPEVSVVLVGGADANAGSVSAQQIAEWREARDVVVEDAVQDVRPHLRRCSVYVLPSYHEGLPRSVLEAMATGRAIVTTDTIGCRDTVFAAGEADGDGIRWGRNGALVPVGDATALAAAMERFVAEPALAVRMGRESRLLAEQYFDVERVNSQMMSEMEMMPAEIPCARVAG